MDSEHYELIQETIYSKALLDRGARERDRARGDTYRSRALCLVERLREEREYRRSTEALVEALVKDIQSLEQTNADLRRQMKAVRTYTVHIHDDERLYCHWCNGALRGEVELLPDGVGQLLPYCRACVGTAMQGAIDRAK